MSYIRLVGLRVTRNIVLHLNTMQYSEYIQGGEDTFWEYAGQTTVILLGFKEMGHKNICFEIIFDLKNKR